MSISACLNTLILSKVQIFCSMELMTKLYVKSILDLLLTVKDYCYTIHTWKKIQKYSQLTMFNTDIGWKTNNTKLLDFLV